MRPIKFRVWNGVQMDVNPYLEVEGRSEDFPINSAFDYRGLVWMQFTGLVDKNGVEIWEGDLVRWAIDFANEQVLPVSLHFHPDGNNHQIWRMGDLYNYWNGPDVEVVGNIYENPELMSGQV